MDRTHRTGNRSKNLRRGFVIAILVVAVAGAHYYIRTRNPSLPIQNVKDGKIAVVASFYPLYFFAQEVGGDKAAVVNVTPASAEPHDYEPTAQDVARIEDSRMLLLTGKGLESWGENVQKNIDPGRTLVVTTGDGLMTRQVVEDGQAGTDPHVWLDPLLAKKMVDRIAAGYAKVDPSNAPYYRSRADDLVRRLDGLDASYRNGLAHCVQKDIVTSHAAFGYLATEYGLNQVPISGLSPDAEPSPKQLADIAKFAKDHGVKYIFFESLVSPKLSETIANEVGAKSLVLDPIEGLTGEDIAAGRNYLSVMQDNLKNLQTALQCRT